MVLKSFFHSILMEADKPTDYNKEASKLQKPLKSTDYSKNIDKKMDDRDKDETSKKDNKSTDYSEEVADIGGKEDSDTEDTGEDTDDTPTDYTSDLDDSGSDENADTEDTDEGTDDTATDYTDDLGNSGSDEDTDDTSSDDTGDDNINDKLKKFYLLKDLKSLQIFIEESIDKIINKKRFYFTEKEVDMQVIKNLRNIIEVIGDYLVFKFDNDDYTTALYNYKRFIVAVDINFEMLEKLNEIRDKNIKEKNKDKSSKKVDKKYSKNNRDSPVQTNS